VRKWIETYGVLGASFLVGSSNVVGERLGGPGLQVGTMIRQIVLAGFLASFPVGVQAQGHGAMGAASHGFAAAPRAGIAAPRVGIAPRVIGSRAPVRSGAPRARVGTPVARNTRRDGTRNHFANNAFGNRRDCNSAPGLGFDAPHLVATCGPGTRGFRGSAFGSPFFFPFYEGGFDVPSYAAPVDEGSAAENAQPDPTDTDARESRRRYRASQSAPPAPVADAASAAPTDNDQFIFVRRDGSVFFAVAYAWDNGTLRYVTNEGLRRTVTQDALDLNATQQFNEQRGLTFRLPA
jgi:hypothetical protein